MNDVHAVYAVYALEAFLVAYVAYIIDRDTRRPTRARHKLGKD